jgi:enoyl-CoA hydratase
MPGVTLQWRDDVVVLLIDRPRAANAISLTTMDELEHALDEALASGPRCLLVRGGRDRVFVSGGDVRELAALRTSDEAAEMARRMRGLLDRIATLPIPTVAAINGHAFGGGAEVAIACDFRIATAHALLAFNQSTLAIMPAWGGIERLVDLVGRSRAMHLLLTGKRIDAAHAYNIGLVDHVAETGQLDDYCATFADALCLAPPRVVAQIKEVVNAVRPNHHPDTRDLAIRSFAEAWTAQEHWDAADRAVAAQAERRSRAERAVNPTT